LVDKNKPLRLVAFLNSFTSVSGGDTRFLEIMKRLHSNGAADLVIVTPRLGEAFCRERGLNAKFSITSNEVKIENKVSAILPLFAKRILSALRLNLALEKNSILYSAYQFLPDVLPVWVFRNRKKDTFWVQTLYHFLPPPGVREGSFLRNLIAYLEQSVSFALIRRYADLIFVLNSVVKSQLVKLGFDGNRIYVAGAGVDLSKIETITPSTLRYDGCFLGRLHPSKGIFDLPIIWKSVVSKKKDATLAVVCVGSKNMEMLLTSLIAKEGLSSNIVMLSVVGNEALQIVKSSKVFVFPSHEEGWGIAIGEAMASGLPVVAYDLPAYREIYKQGIIKVSMKDYRPFADAIVSLLEDESARESLGLKARLQVKEYDWSIVARKEQLLMDGLLAQVSSLEC
jgi:glycosyltransferase involved in cell wall biosynthesis